MSITAESQDWLVCIDPGQGQVKPFERHLKAVAPAFEALHRSNISLQACLLQMYTGAAPTKAHDLLKDMLFAQSDDIRSTLWLEIG